MAYGRSLERHLKRFCLPLTYSEWAPIAKNRADWRKRVAQPPFAIRQPFVRRPRGDTRRTPEQKREDEERRAAETAERRQYPLSYRHRSGIVCDIRPAPPPPPPPSGI